MTDKGLQDWLKKHTDPAHEADQGDNTLSAAERAELTRFDRLWEAAAPPANDTAPVDTAAAWKKVDDRLFGEEKVIDLNQGRSAAPTWMKYLRIAAALLVLAVAGFQLRAFLSDGTATSLVYQTTSEVQEITLPDGTEISLNLGSELTYVADATTRLVTLTGEAFFDVARNEDQPFSIATGELTTTVLGTSFNVRAYPNEEKEISVKTGKVSVAAADAEVILTPSERVVYRPATKTLAPKAETIVDAEAWRTKELVFKASPLRLVLPELEKYYGVTFEIENEQLLACPFDGTYLNYDLPAMIESLTFILDAEAKRDGERVIITGGSCN